MSALCHVWTAPGCKSFLQFAALVGAAMCSACSCGTRKAAGHNALRGSGPGLLSESWRLNSTHLHGTHVPVEEPPTASKADSCTVAISYSITSSAVVSDEGMVRPSDFAVLRLMTNSNLADWMTGTSATLVPLMMRPT